MTHPTPITKLFVFWPYLAMTILVLAYHFPLLLPGIGMPPWGDYYVMHAPYRIYAALSLVEGRFPFWTNGIFCGYPIFADPQFALLFPTNFLFSLIEPNPDHETARDLYVLFHLLLHALSAVYLLRAFALGALAALVGALCLTFNGFIQMHITHINIIQTITFLYLAAAFLARFVLGGGLDKRLIVYAALMFCIAHLAGHPQTILFGHYGIAVGLGAVTLQRFRGMKNAATVWRIASWASVAVLLGAMLAAVQLLPTVGLLKRSGRAAMQQGEAMDEAVDLHGMGSMIFPGFYYPLPWRFGEGDSWFRPTSFTWLCQNPLEGLTFGGLTMLLLALIGYLSRWKSPMRNVLFWGSVFLLLCSVGKDLPFYEQLYMYLPGVKAVRVPSRVLWLFYTAIGVLVALGVRSLVSKDWKAIRFSMATTGAVLAIMLDFAIAMVFINHTDDWFSTFRRLLIADRKRFEDDVILRANIFLETLRMQFWIGVGVVSVAAGWLAFGILRPSLAKPLVAVPIILMFFELFTYGFGKSYLLDRPAGGPVVAKSFGAHQNPPVGRMVVPHFVRGGGAQNIAMFNGKPLAPAYSVTVSEWTTAFQPQDHTPWRLGMEETLHDLANVTDVVLPFNPVIGNLMGHPIPVSDWGWTEIAAPANGAVTEIATSSLTLRPSRLEVNTDVTSQIAYLYLLAAGAQTSHIEQGTEIARLMAFDDTSSKSVTFPIRLGIETSDANYDRIDPESGFTAQHKQLPVGLTRKVPHHWTDGTQFYFAIWPIESPMRVDRITLEATGPFPSALAVNQLYLTTTENGLVPLQPVESAGYKKVEAQASSVIALTRPETHGYAWMVPKARVANYREIGNVLQHMFANPLDIKQEIVLDKKRVSKIPLAEIDTTAPLQSRVKIVKRYEEEQVYEVETSRDAWLFLSSTYDPGWSAKVDGENTEVFQANGPYTAVRVPAGKHTIKLKYLPEYLLDGLFLSLMAAAALGTIWWRAGRAADCRLAAVPGHRSS